MKLAYGLYMEERAEAVFCVSNKELTKHLFMRWRVEALLVLVRFGILEIADGGQIWHEREASVGFVGHAR